MKTEARVHKPIWRAGVVKEQGCTTQAVLGDSAVT